MAISSSPFRSYDIRGLVGSELTPFFAQKLGIALVKVFRPARALIGFDMRETSPVFAHALAQSLERQGIVCQIIGLCTTPVFYHAVSSDGTIDLGVMVTASHNPSTYNGFKICRKEAIPVGFGSGMEEIREAFGGVEVEEYKHEPTDAPSSRAVDAYLETVLARLPDRGHSLKVGQPKSIKVVADAGNGMAGLTLPVLARLCPRFHLLPLFWELDGTFPNHEANPLHLASLEQAQELVLKSGACCGFAFDGDGDRIGVIDEKGDVVPGDMLTAVLALELLRVQPGATILYDLRSSWSVPEMIREAGGVPMMCRVGHAHIKKQMRETGALFAGELAMHFYFSSFAYCEASEYVMLLLVELIERSGKSLSQLWRPLQRYAHSGEINTTLTGPADEIFTRLRERFATQASSASELDGLRYEFRDARHPEGDWWFNVRAANTEPLIRLNLETRHPDLLKRRIEEVQALIHSPSS